MYNRFFLVGFIVLLLLMNTGCSIRTDIGVGETSTVITIEAETQTTMATVKPLQEWDTIAGTEADVTEMAESSALIIELDYDKNAFIEYLEANNIVYGRGAYAKEYIVTSEQDEEGNWHEYLYVLNEDECRWELVKELDICRNISDVHRKYCDGIKEIVVRVTRQEEIAIVIDYGSLGKIFAVTGDEDGQVEFCSFPEQFNRDMWDINAFYYNNGVMLLGLYDFVPPFDEAIYVSYDKGDTWNTVGFELGDILANSVRAIEFFEYNEDIICRLGVEVYNAEASTVYVNVLNEDNKVESDYAAMTKNSEGYNDYYWEKDNLYIHSYISEGFRKLAVEWQGLECVVDSDITGSIYVLEPQVDFDGDGENELLFYSETGARGSKQIYLLDIYGGALKCLKYEVPKLEYKVLNDYRIWYNAEAMEYPGIIDLSKDEYFNQSWWDEKGNTIEGKQYDVWPYTTYDIDYYMNEDGSYTIVIGTDICVESGAGACKILYSYYKLEDGELKIIERR